MKTNRLSLKYELFCRLLQNENIFLVPSLTFSSLCGKIHVPEEDLNDYLLSELGIGGQELMDSFRNQYPAYLLKKYGKDVFL